MEKRRVIRTLVEYDDGETEIVGLEVNEGHHDVLKNALKLHKIMNDRGETIEREDAIKEITAAEVLQKISKAAEVKANKARVKAEKLALGYTEDRLGRLRPPPDFDKKPQPKAGRACIINGKEYISASYASAKTGFSRAQIISRCNNPKATGWQWKD